MKIRALILLAFVCLFHCSGLGQTTLFSEDFEGGGPSMTLNTSDLGGTASPNFWIVNNVYTGGSGSLVCMGFPFTYTIANTPTQTFHTNTTSKYLHTMSIYGQADNIFCSSFAAADGFCIFNSSNFCKKNAGINTVGYNNVTLKFWWNCAGGTNIYGEVYYSTDGGTTWTLISVPISQYKNQGTWVQQSIALPAFNGVADLRFAYRFVNNQSSSALDPGFSIDDIVVEGTTAASQTITTGTVSSLSVCAGDTVQVPFTISGSFNVGNVFTAELSDATGGFLSPVSIGSLTGTSAGTIQAIIPPGTPAGANYRIRVVASNPTVTGTTNVSDITVNTLPTAGTAFVTGSSTICEGSSITITLQGFTGNLVWESSPNGTNWTSTGITTNPLQMTLNTVTWFRAMVTNTCGTAYSAPVSITVVPTNQNFAHGILSRDSICDGDTTTVQMVYWGSSIIWYTSSNGGTTWNQSANTHPGTYHTPPLNGANQNMVRGIVDNGVCGFDTIDVSIYVEHVVAAFTETNIGPVFAFTDASTNAVTWAWDFGDGSTSTVQNPLHSYASSGSYTVTLTVTGPLGCVSTVTQTVSVVVGVDGPEEVLLSVSPNPFEDVFEIQMLLPIAADLEIALFDLSGKMMGHLFEKGSPAGVWSLKSNQLVGELPQGVYFLKVGYEGNAYAMKVVKL